MPENPLSLAASPPIHPDGLIPLSVSMSKARNPAPPEGAHRRPFLGASSLIGTHPNPTYETGMMHFAQFWQWAPSTRRRGSHLDGVILLPGVLVPPASAALFVGRQAGRAGKAEQEPRGRNDDMWAEYCEGALRAGASYCSDRVMGFVKLQWACLLDHPGLLLRNTTWQGREPDRVSLA